MSEGGRRVFVYRQGRNWGPILILIYGSGAIALLATIAHPALLPVDIFLAVAAWTLTSLFLSWRPIAIGEERIDVLLGTRPWRTIEWRDVDRIEKRVRAEESDGEGGITPRLEVIYFRSGRRRISAMSTIVDFEALKQQVTEKAKRRGIALALVDPQPFWHAPILTPLDEL